MTTTKDILYKNYYNIDSPSYLSTPNYLYAQSKTQIKNLKLKEVKNWLKTQTVYTLHHPIKNKFQRNPTISHYVDEFWQMDLMDMSKFEKANYKYCYVLMVIDVLSKFGWVKLLKTKHPFNVIEGLEEIFKSGRKCKYLVSDAGREFLNIQMSEFLKNNNITQIIARNDVKASVVERWIRTIKEKIYKYFTLNKTTRYYNILHKLVNNYNKTVHSRTKFKPIDVTSHNEKIVFKNLYGIKQQSTETDLQVGDLVRLKRLKMSFEKGATPNWTEDIFKISKVLTSFPRKLYWVKGEFGDVLGSFYKSELQKIFLSNNTK